MDADQDLPWKVNQSGRDWLSLRGELVVVGKSPDGDSIRFAPETPSLLGSLTDGERAEPSEDGTVQLRLDGIDTPETHYGNLAQPLGDAARDELLAWCGFTGVRWSGDQVVAATPERIPAAALSRLVDVNGRPVVLLLVGDGLPADGVAVPASEWVGRSANLALASSGAAYGTVYATTEASVREALLAPAREARSEGRGVWARDASGGFELRSQASIGPEGALILPKLFRRCSDYLRSRSAGQTLPEWLRAQQGGRDPQDDAVIVDGETLRFSDLISQAGDRISLLADPLEILFLD